MKKLAIIRDICPFGLNVNFACKTANISVDQMQSLDKLDPNTPEEEKLKIIKQNLIILKQNPEIKPCKYAAHIFPTKKSVDCDYGDTAAGQHNPTFVGSDYYEQLFNGVGFNGLYAIPPMSGANDPYYLRNLYYGMSEFAFKKERMNIRKIALLKLAAKLG